MAVSYLALLAIVLGVLGLLAAIGNAFPPHSGAHAIAGAILFAAGLLALAIAGKEPRR